MALYGKAPLTVCRTSSGYVQVYAGVPAPDHILPEDAERLLAEGYLEERGDAAGDDGNDGSTGPVKVADILAKVGDDPAKAQAALDAEREERGEDARPSLVKKLEAVIANGAS